MVEMKQDDLGCGKLDLVANVLIGSMYGTDLTDESKFYCPGFNSMNGDVLKLSQKGIQRLENKIINAVFNSIK